MFWCACSSTNPNGITYWTPSNSSIRSRCPRLADNGRGRKARARIRREFDVYGGIFSTGNELAAPGDLRDLRGVYASNSTRLAGAVEEAGAFPRFRALLAAMHEEIGAALERVCPCAPALPFALETAEHDHRNPAP